MEEIQQHGKRGPQLPFFGATGRKNIHIFLLLATAVFPPSSVLSRQFNHADGDEVLPVGGDPSREQFCEQFTTDPSHTHAEATYLGTSHEN